VGYSADGKLVATADKRGRLRVWDAETGRHIWETSLAPGAAIEDLRFSSDSRSLAACGQTDWVVDPLVSLVSVWTADGDKLSTFHTEMYPDRLAFSPDGSRLLVGRTDPESHLSIWQLAPPDRLIELPPNFWGQLKALQFAVDGRHVLSVDIAGRIVRWDTSSATGADLFIADRQPGRNTGPSESSQVGSAVFTSDGSSLITSTDESLCLWDVAAGTLKGTITVPEAPHGFTIGLSPDGRTLAASEVNYAGAPGTDVIRVFDLEARQVVLTLSPGDARAMSFAFSPDGKRLLTGLDNGTAIVWDVSR
jgi:WD40 repeat protein